ncbi:MAG: phosphate ABC transporter substrate-binding protein PstS [Microbacteriaceae bacterium]|nr:phosphate ABC transporter substrate-binding protein PstS [Microbacteriaceae bacterium]
MNFTRFSRAAVIATVGAIALSSCAANEGAAPSASNAPVSTLAGTINGSGASSQGSAQEAWIAGFQTANQKVTINYAPDGSGAGRKAFIAGGVNFAGSDSALSDTELAGTFGSCVAGTKAIDLPIYISPIAVIFNVAGVTKLNLDAATIAGIFKGAITTWNDPAIVALNPDAKLPAATITAVHRGDDSGTTKNFADYLNKVAPAVWDKAPADTFPYAGGEGAQGTAGVVASVTNGTNTIGYADASKAGKLGVAAIKVGSSFVNYTAAAAAAVVEESPLVAGRGDSDIAIAINRTTTDASHYPLVLVSYLIVCGQYTDVKAGAVVKAYASYIAGDGQKVAAAKAGSAPLSATLAGKVSKAIAAIK